MVSADAFLEAKHTLSTAHETRANLCGPFLAVSPATGASVSILAGTSGQSTVCATDDTAARLDELQFDLGEGPCWSALSSGRPVVARQSPDAARRWPMFAEAVRRDQLGSRVGTIFAFPMSVGPLEIGAVDLYSDAPSDLSAETLAELSELARIAAFQVLRRILGGGVDESIRGSVGSRREVHQATGMVLAQLDVSAEDAGLILRAHAFSTGRPVRDVALEVIARKLDFAATDDRPAGDGEE